MPKTPRSRSRGRSTTRRKTSPPATKPSPAPSSRASSIFPSRSGQKPTLYDAVAGHVTPHGLITAPSYHVPSYYRDVPAHGTEKILKPSEVLAGSKGVGEGEERYAAHRFLVDGATEKARAERAIEDANAQDPLVDGLQPDEDEERVEDGRWRHEQVQRLKARVKVGRLPDSDLLKAVHAFAGLFYEACGSHFDFRSLDETALLACGVLLEETVRDELGESGDLVFLEGAEDGASRVRKDESSGEVEEASTTRKHRKQKRDEGDSSPATQNDTEQEEQTGKRGKKRRKLDEDAQSRFGEEW